ncbi:ribonuclease H2 subunit A, putative [Plasmodium berghei]|uniref:Ribonuclease n=2 Tax=Plasmodium berghei TaxID=5821 RepID=A0A509AP87_PLABA|nr:ribonuclease H2 subunit A, putative [Plasmodium berghei ANKA]CXI64470.1 ribonuclease H2 subunit A, putative [Plasmodium berghei]SCM23878.1 ribonuclease H2 subunit A, putative [Plasmodium berghei]SCN26818.1 ribonuclease H2 subunit A, putative [Plasmodium berghei]SCO61182.1 ribonuclease H2 subunit A, putative [Plasmodium berghei]SCO63238.1 ribonuclease H2 subunit A, putative [Plasmodium berghei]|eukprot:XP_034422435.1 ribonuclease H2 subunit A, putative [Plasmodium berghei ANKA]
MEPILIDNLYEFGNEEVRLGIDEAGRGPVLGPMVYSGFYCKKEDEKLLKEMKIDDSKKITEHDREKMFYKLNNSKLPFAWRVHILMPQDISAKMLKRQKYNLNEISHDTAISIIQHVLNRGCNLTEVFVDTVGKASVYEEKLQKLFPNIKCVVKEKADSLYPVVSAASICAKVTRDFLIKKWKYEEHIINIDKGFGSGYPGDPVTKNFLKNNFDPIFGFPSIVRFSWSTADTMLENLGEKIEWYDEEESNNSKAMKRKIPFDYSKLQKPLINRSQFYAKNGLDLVSNL